MSFSHSAFSTMNTNLAKEVLAAKMMPERFSRARDKQAATNKQKKTSAYSVNVNLQKVLLAFLFVNWHLLPWPRTADHIPVSHV
jgi:hypothetical protein